jgi:TrmH family RNA methyltransferase
VTVRFVLHRPRSSENIGAAARAIANTSAGELWVVEPLGFDRGAAAKLAAGADRVLESMRVVRTLDEALADCVDVVMTTARPTEGALEPRGTAERLLSSPRDVALVFGDEVSGLTNRQLARAAAVATIPTTEKRALNLAQAVLIFAYEVMLAQREAPPALPPREPLADERLLGLLRERSRALLLSASFLNPQQPDAVLDELVRLLRRAGPTRREAELLLAACEQLARSLVKP